jgi:hypothetical protein
MTTVAVCYNIIQIATKQMYLLAATVQAMVWLLCQSPTACFMLTHARRYYQRTQLLTSSPSALPLPSHSCCCSHPAGVREPVC